jgi:hypothetical protein
LVVVINLASPSSGPPPHREEKQEEKGEDSVLDAKKKL